MFSAFECLASAEMADNVLFARFAEAAPFFLNCYLQTRRFSVIWCRSAARPGPWRSYFVGRDQLWLRGWAPIHCIAQGELPLVQARFGAGVDRAKVKIRE